MTVRRTSYPTTGGAAKRASSSQQQQQQPMMKSPTNINKKGPEFVAVVLASSTGTRLFPLTASSSSLLSTTSTLASSEQQSHPKHLLPVAGIPMLHRLLHTLETSLQFTACVVAIAHQDQVTLPSLQQLYKDTDDAKQQQQQKPSELNVVQTAAPATLSSHRSVTVIPTTISSSKWKLTVVRLPEDCSGSGQALRALEQATYDDNVDSSNSSSSSNRCLPIDSHLVVLPSDLIVLDPAPLRAILQAHRHEQQLRHSTSATTKTLSTACTVLLTNVGEVDEHGVPLKESAKHKKGGLAREEEEIEYIALSTLSSSSSSSNGSTSSAITTPPRLIWKQAKLDAEEDEHMSGSTPKLKLPKTRLQSGHVVKVRMDWDDVHVYVLAPWVRSLVQARDSIVSLKEDLVPLLVSRQFKGVVATFGSSSAALLANHTQVGTIDGDTGTGDNGDGSADHHDESSSFSSSFPLLEELTRSFAALDLRNSNARSTTTVLAADETMATTMSSEKHAVAVAAASLPLEYAVRAIVQEPTVLRSHTVPAYLYANRELTRKAMEHSRDASLRPALPPNSVAKAKFQTLLLSGTTLGDKVTFKATVIGKDCQIGSKCRLNNVVLLDHVHVADNTILQNTVVAQGAKIGEHCSLNACQVGPDKVVPAGTKGKEETFLVDDLL